MPAAWDRPWLVEAAQRIDEPRVWRGVSAQQASTIMQLVDTGEQYAVLERLLDKAAPPDPHGQGKHALLMAPFRHVPEHASRFRPVGHHGLWYGAIRLRAACAEVAYWRWVFMRDSAAPWSSTLISRHVFFAAHVSGRGINLTAAPWDAAHGAWTDGRDYTETHRLGRAAEEAGIEVIRYASVRSPGDINLAVLTPAALGEPFGGLDASRQTWWCSTTRTRVLLCRDSDPQETYDWVP